MFCRDCVVLTHKCLPLHSIREWTGAFWVQTCLKDLGLVIQLGHQPGSVCYLPKPPHSDDFLIINNNGIHPVTLRFCGCETADTHVQQLLRHRLFPASTDRPRTAATFSMLEEYHLLSLESKVSSYHYYAALARRNNNTGLTPSKDRYKHFMRIVREWRHLKMLKRAGRGHDPAGVDNTKEGECAVLCPACPHPGKNLPDDWDKVPTDKEWLYALSIAIDANFRLKRRLSSKDSVDPSLSRGWSYFVEELSYKLYSSEHSNTRQEKSACSSHDAINGADTKNSVGLAATGTGSVCCARHETKLAGGVGDLQKGERYVNMDYLFFSALRGTAVKCVNVSYDIVCQWERHLWERMLTLPFTLHFPFTERKVTTFVPKFHLPAHVAECQWKYTFNYIKGAARTDGEAPERGWSTLNAASSSTKEMGPGHRRDVLDDLMGDSNWKKRIGLGETILRKIIEAIPERNEHKEDFYESDQSLSARYAKQLAKWKTEVEAWEHDRSRPNPFEGKSASFTQASIRLQLANDEAKRAMESNVLPIHLEISPSILISMGIDFEDQQRRLHADSGKLGLHATDQQKARMQERTNALVRHIEAWANVQVIYIPGVASIRARSLVNFKSALRPQDFNLWLPSALQRQVPCDTRLEEIEWKLRFGQAHDALNELRQALRSRSYMLCFKDWFLRGQGANTRARNCLKSVDTKIDSSAVKYRTAHGALLALSLLLGKVGWMNSLRPLENEDIRAMTAGTNDCPTEGRRRLSWIWLVCGYSESDAEQDGDEGLQDAIRIEWCKIRARAHRWAEEVDLLFEEQRRMLQFLRWEANWWSDRQSRGLTNDPAVDEGLKAYALRQAALRVELGKYFTRTWCDTEKYSELGDDGRCMFENDLGRSLQPRMY
ncbi:hypothetical protein PAXRUDRAFT_393130 [Paxillus rubicundulus Ve08.2h10]|uniref:CxC2-like cysteine cluster KDZ transposase-associated domain-containing protein n=1 Tax=Paxillus rubicundulus Ve08.2h10 TaxID=930991 RepID=A0A0D0D0T3_9AGAM|nr:hypothetical protein PAXRUDRAFT_393130 [Paxillus rubicundulus Ve08.2h10]